MATNLPQLRVCCYAMIMLAYAVDFNYVLKLLMVVLVCSIHTHNSAAAYIAVAETCCCCNLSVGGGEWSRGDRCCVGACITHRGSSLPCYTNPLVNCIMDSLLIFSALTANVIDILPCIFDVIVLSCS